MRILWFINGNPLIKDVSGWVASAYAAYKELFPNDEIIMADMTAEQNEYVCEKGVEVYSLASDLYYMASKIEGFGISAVEALACGLPTLLADTVGLKDFKTLESDYINYTNFGENCFAKALEEAYGRFKDNRSNSPVLADKVKQTYNEEKSVKEYLELYNAE